MREGQEKGNGKGSEGRVEGTGEGRGSSFTPDQKRDFWVCRWWAGGSQCLVFFLVRFTYFHYLTVTMGEIDPIYISISWFVYPYVLF